MDLRREKERYGYGGRAVHPAAKEKQNQPSCTCFRLHEKEERKEGDRPPHRPASQPAARLRQTPTEKDTPTPDEKSRNAKIRRPAKKSSRPARAPRHADATVDGVTVAPVGMGGGTSRRGWGWCFFDGRRHKAALPGVSTRKKPPSTVKATRFASK
jgi:hypothetical protein